jgi:hypothetical protein
MDMRWLGEKQPDRTGTKKRRAVGSPGVFLEAEFVQQHIVIYQPRIR